MQHLAALKRRFLHSWRLLAGMFYIPARSHHCVLVILYAADGIRPRTGKRTRFIKSSLIGHTKFVLTMGQHVDEYCATSLFRGSHPLSCKMTSTRFRQWEARHVLLTWQPNHQPITIASQVHVKTIAAKTQRTPTPAVPTATRSGRHVKTSAKYNDYICKSWTERLIAHAICIDKYFALVVLNCMSLMITICL